MQFYWCAGFICAGELIACKPTCRLFFLANVYELSRIFIRYIRSLCYQIKITSRAWIGTTEVITRNRRRLKGSLAIKHLRCDIKQATLIWAKLRIWFIGLYWFWWLSSVFWSLMETFEASKPDASAWMKVSVWRFESSNYLLMSSDRNVWVQVRWQKNTKIMCNSKLRSKTKRDIVYIF